MLSPICGRFWPLLGAVFFSLPIPAQVLLTNRGYQPSPGHRIARANGTGFVADHFRVGSNGETWVIDTVRTWAAPDQAGKSVKLGDLYERIGLYGGIENPIPKPGEPVCDCHNLVALKDALLRPDSDDPGAGVRVFRTAPRIWEVTFQNLNWSVPGGIEIEFGVMGVGRTRPVNAREPWYSRAAPDGGPHQLRIFDDKGKFEGLYTENGLPLNADIGVNVQVWGHKPASISIHAGKEALEVVLRSDATVDAAKADLASLRFGPAGAAPLRVRLQPGNGRAELLLEFNPLETGINATSVNACLEGRLQDGVPFQGCDLLSAHR